MESLVFFIYSIMSSAYNDNFASSLPIWIPFVSFSYLIAVARTSNTMQNRSSPHYSFKIKPGPPPTWHSTPSQMQSLPLPMTLLGLHGLITWISLPLLYKLDSLANPATGLLLPKFQDSVSQYVFLPFSAHHKAQQAFYLTCETFLTHSDHLSSKLHSYSNRHSYSRQNKWTSWSKQHQVLGCQISQTKKRKNKTKQNKTKTLAV